jgi:hypothetical protein
MRASVFVLRVCFFGMFFRFVARWNALVKSYACQRRFGGDLENMAARWTDALLLKSRGNVRAGLHEILGV